LGKSVQAVYLYYFAHLSPAFTVSHFFQLTDHHANSLHFNVSLLQEKRSSCRSWLDWGWRWCRHGHGLLILCTLTITV